MKIRAAQAYVMSIKKIRIFFVGALFVFLALLLLIKGLSLIQEAFFTYSMWSNETKFIAALILGGLEFLGAIGILVYLFREETWSRFTGIHKVVNFVIEQEDKNNEITNKP